MPWRINQTGTVAQCQAAVNNASTSGLTSSEAAQLARAQTYLLAEIAVYASAAKLQVSAFGQINPTAAVGWARMQTLVQPFQFVNASGEQPTELAPNAIATS